MSEEPASSTTAETPEGQLSIFLVSLHILMWTVLVCGFVMTMVVVMLNL